MLLSSLLLLLLLLAGSCRADLKWHQQARAAATPSPSPNQVQAAQLTEPTAAPSAAPTPAICPDELELLDGCFSSGQSGAGVTRGACESCVIQYWGERAPATCGELRAGTCHGLDACECGACQAQVESYIQCLSECAIDCSAPPTISPAPTESPAPTATAQPSRTIVCPAEYEAFNDCVDPDAGGAECEACLVGMWPDTVAKCSDVVDPTCPGLANCVACRGCEPAWTTYLACLTDGCTVPDCSGNSTGPSSPAQAGPTSPTASPAPTSHSCPDERESVRECLDAAGLSADECSGCIQASFPATFSECGDIDDGICASLLTCPCGGCDAQILSQINCAFEARFEKPCQLSCANGTSTASIAPAGSPKSSSPGPSPASPASPCPEERLAFDACASESVSASSTAADAGARDAGAAFSECEACVVDGHWPDQGTLTHCSEIKNATCVGVSACPACSGCEQEFLAYVRCYSGGCGLNCGLDSANGTSGGSGPASSPPGPSATQTSSGAAAASRRWFSTFSPVMLAGAYAAHLWV